jgi:Divergent InlB B-repeat domain/Chitobiase/beta-hexosaminidase C-terminal domain/Immunoglobulin I-set domain
MARTKGQCMFGRTASGESFLPAILGVSLCASFVLLRPSPGLSQCNPPFISMPDMEIPNQTAAVGQTITFCQATPNGTPPMYYQWLHNGRAIGGATGQCVTLTNVQLSDAGDYQVFITNACGSTLSQTNFNLGFGHLTTGYPPALVVPPQNQNVVTGQTANFSIVVTGTPPISYYWMSQGQYNPVAPYGTNASLTNVQSFDAGPVRVNITNPFGSTNATAMLFVSVPPTISVQPVGGVILVDSDVSLTVTAAGTYHGPTSEDGLSYQWQRNGVDVPGGTSNVLSLQQVQVTDAGAYTVVVSNPAGTTNSTVASVDVRYAFVLADNQMLPGTNYTYPNAVTLKFQNAFPGGSIFYTLDGSPPTFASAYYSGPFSLTQSARLRALAYNADFSKYGEVDPVNFTILPPRSLTTTTAGGGSISLNPPGGTYASGSPVTVTATPATGWTFLYWLGDASGTNSMINVTMDQNKVLLAIFGTTLGTTVAGNGTVALFPASTYYPYGSVVRLTATPQPGSYFGVWGNAASGNTNPLYFTITSPTQTVSSLFVGRKPVRTYRRA